MNLHIIYWMKTQPKRKLTKWPKKDFPGSSRFRLWARFCQRPKAALKIIQRTSTGVLLAVHKNSLMNPYLSVSSLQFGLFSPADTCFTPESCRLLLLRSSPVRLEDWELRAEDRTAHPSSERLQTLSLKRQLQRKRTAGIKMNHL